METLANWIHRRGPISPRDAVGWAIRLAKHLEALHQHGVAHGNISPAALFIESNSPTSRGTIADVRKTAEMLQYHSPERLRSGQLSPHDDTWGVAGTLFTAITGARPFGEQRQEVETRVQRGLPPLAAFGVEEDYLQNILAGALTFDPSRRIPSVAFLRQELERWCNDPSVLRLPPLDDDESGEEDHDSTAMVATGGMNLEEPPSQTDSRGHFAPPSFPQSRAAPSAQRPAQLDSSPQVEADQTVMRALPAHIMALAARAAAGSDPPPAMRPGMSEPDTDAEDTGGATRVAPAMDLQSVIQATRAAPPPNAGPMAPRAPVPSAPEPGSGRPGVPRGLRSTQLGVGAQQPPPQAFGGAAPRPGFAPPPAALSSAPPPMASHLDDEIRTVMHEIEPGVQAMAARAASGLAPQPPRAPVPPRQMPPPMQQAPAPPPDEDDDDDGGRTRMRESPGAGPDAYPVPRAAGQPAWSPASPPANSGPFASSPRPAAGAPGPGVSALIAETLENLGGPTPPPAPGGPFGGAPPGFPSGPSAPIGFGNSDPNFVNEPTGGFGGQSLGMGLGGAPLGGAPAGGAFANELTGGFGTQPFNNAGPSVAGPFQPLGLGASAPANNPAPFPPFSPPAAPLAGLEPLPGFGAEPAPANFAPQPDYMRPPNTAPEPVAEPQQGSRAGLVLVCLLVLILAATITFLGLRYRALLGI